MELAIIADTHLPRGARRIPDACLERLAAADAILHAGDLVQEEVLALLQAWGRPCTRSRATSTSRRSACGSRA